MAIGLTVSLAAIGANYETVSSHAGCDAAAVVKADAYGLGVAAVAPYLLAQGCREFFVATADEAQRLRGLCAEATIYVLEGVRPATLQVLCDSKAIPVLNTAAQIDLWQSVGQAAALHIDTGMQRLGLPPDTAMALGHLGFEVVLLVTHFACADAQDPDQALAQVQEFEQSSLGLRRAFPQARLSCSNSAASLAGGVGEHLVRAGVAMYGGNPFSGVANPMLPVVALRGPVLQVREVAAGVAVGYGASFITARATRLATVGIGYADGLPRLLSNAGQACIGDERVPIVGRISMDMVQLDVTDLSGGVVEGDEAELIGPQITVEDVAQQAQTLGYEVLTGLDAARRLERHYIESLLTAPV